MSKNLKCFVIMPITTPVSSIDSYNGDKNHFDNILEHLFTPAIIEAGFEPVFPKSTGSDLIQAIIIEKLSTSDLVLCDISILNPNVFFELGIRTALNKPVALVIDDKTEKIPFDTSIINCHYYNSLPLWSKENEIEKLSKHITASYQKSEDSNTLWKYFGITQTGAFKPDSATDGDKLNYIIQKLESEKVVINSQESAFSSLTQSEMKVLLLICDGKTNRGIAKELNLGEGTVRNYVSNILSKLGLSNRAEAATYATEYGIKNIMS